MKEQLVLRRRSAGESQVASEHRNWLWSFRSEITSGSKRSIQREMKTAYEMHPCIMRTNFTEYALVKLLRNVGYGIDEKGNCKWANWFFLYREIIISFYEWSDVSSGEMIKRCDDSFLYIHYYSVALNTRQDWIGNRRRDGMRWFAYNVQEDRICNQVLWERLCQVVRSSVWRWHERFCTILLLDEATSALDRENQDTFLTALRAWRINGARWWQWRIVWARLWTVISSTWSTMVW